MKEDLGKGQAQTMILAVLSSGPLHGYAVAREIELRSDNMLTCQEGILYPALRALEREELVSAEWQIQSSGPARKVYTLTKKGKAVLTQRTAAWRQFEAAMGNVLGGKTNERKA